MSPLLLTFSLTLLIAVTWTASRMVFSLYALSLGAQPFSIGILYTAFNLFPLLLSWPAGRLSDRLGPHLPLTVSAVSGLGVAIPFFVHSVAALYVAAALVGMSFSLYLVNAQNLVGLLSTPERRAHDFSTFSLLGSASNFIGPLGGGFAIDHVGHAATSLGLVVLPVLAAILLGVWGRGLPGGSRKEQGPQPSMLETLANRAIWPMLITSSLVKLGTDLYQFYLPIYGHRIGLSASAVGAVLATFAGSQFIVRTVLPQLIQRLGEERMLAYAFYCAAVGFLLTPFTHAAALLAVASFIFGIGMGCGQPLTTIMLFSTSAAGRSGETLGLRLTVNNAVRAIGPPLFGFIASALGLTPVFFLNAVMMVLGGVMSRPARKEEAVAEKATSS
jgi:MFS family permease